MSNQQNAPLHLVISHMTTPRGIMVRGWTRDLRFDSAESLNAFLQHVGRGESFTERDLSINGSKKIQALIPDEKMQHAESLYSSGEDVFREQRRFIADLIESLKSQSPGSSVKTQAQPRSFRVDYNDQYCFIHLSSPENGVERKLSIQFNDSLQSLHLTPLKLFRDQFRWDVAPSNSTLGAEYAADARSIARRVKDEFAVSCLSGTKTGAQGC
jgi:hypothetical protein